MKKLGLSIFTALCCALLAIGFSSCSSSGSEPENPKDDSGNGGGTNGGTTTPEGYEDLPADPSPDTYTGFVHRVLAADFTGTWCIWCPRVIAGMRAYNAKYTDDKVVFIGVHNSDVMSNEYGDAIGSWASGPELPLLSYNLDNKALLNQGSYDTGDVTAEKIRADIENLSAPEAQTGISGAVSLSSDKKTVTVKAKVKVGKDGKYRIGAWLLEDGIVAKQANQSPETWSDNYDTHANVVVGGTTKKAVGDYLNGKDPLPKGSLGYFTGTIPTTYVKDIANCRVVIYVTALNTERNNYYVDNIVTCQIGKTVAFEYKQ